MSDIEKTCSNCKYEDERANGPHCGCCVHNAVENFVPKSDKVKVVRCKDCVHRGVAFECPMCRREYNDDYDEIIIDYAKDNGFCNWGERRKGS